MEPNEDADTDLHDNLRKNDERDGPPPAAPAT
jgi:hypothetical protein